MDDDSKRHTICASPALKASLPIWQPIRRPRSYLWNHGVLLPGQGYLPGATQAIIGKVPFPEVEKALLGLIPLAQGGFGTVYRVRNFSCERTEDRLLRCSCFGGEVAVKVITRGTAEEREHDFRQELLANAGTYGLWSCSRSLYYTCGRPSAALAAQLGLLDSNDPVYIQVMPLAKHGSLRDLLCGKSRCAN